MTNNHIKFKQILSFFYNSVCFNYIIISTENLKYLMLQLVYHETDATLTRTES